MKWSFGFLVILCSVVLLRKSCATLYDFYYTFAANTAESHTKLCKDKGYDGLAIIATGEAYSYFMELTATIRDNFYVSFYIGLDYDPAIRRHVWADGQVMAYDIFAHPPPSDGLNKGYVDYLGQFWVGNKTDRLRAICGYHQRGATEGFGKIFAGKEVLDASSDSIIWSAKVSSFVSCVAICAGDSRFRTAEFNSETQSCLILHEGTYNKATNPKASVFKRKPFI